MNRECLILFFSIYLFVASSSLRLSKNELDFLKQKFVERRVSPKLDDEVDVDLWNRLNEQEIANSPSIDDFSNEENALRWLKWYFRIAERFYQVSAVLSWRYETNITVENEKLKSQQALRRSPFISQVVPIAQRFSEELKNSNNQRVRRIFNHLARTTINDDATLQSVSQLSSQMTAIYSTSKVCSGEKCFSLSPDLESFMQNEKDYDRLLWAWKSWHDQCGNQIRPIYLDYIDLINENLKKNGKINLAEHWIAEYEMGNAREFEGTTDRLLDEIMPLYRELHGYVRGRLCEIYPKRFDCTGPIPAHLLGNMWAQAWQNRFDDFIAYPDAPLINMTEIFENKSISIHEMYRMAENLFTSIGLYPMTKKFWSRSLFRKPTDRDVVCHAAASDFDYRDDYRVRICTERNEEHFYTIHHEMGHIQYYMSYDESQPFVYRNGANSGFHEAIGDTIGMFALSPMYLKKLSFLKRQQLTDEFQINFLLRMALQKIAFLPFGYVMDKYRFSLFRNEIDRENQLNSAWWQLRKTFAGIQPPTERNDSINFDPGAKYHVPSNVPYFRYFIAHILQFQFYRSMCRLKGHDGYLHMCNIYGDKVVGKRFKHMLSMGSSEPWPNVLEMLDGETELTSDAILEYFQPLYRWLKTENRLRQYPIGWE